MFFRTHGVSRPFRKEDTGMEQYLVKDSPNFQDCLQEIDRIRNRFLKEHNVMHDLTQYIRKHGSVLKHPVCLEMLLQLVDGPLTIQKEEAYCREVFRISNLLDPEMESALSFSASVKLHMLRYWAARMGWAER